VHDYPIPDPSCRNFIPDGTLVPGLPQDIPRPHQMPDLDIDPSFPGGLRINLIRYLLSLGKEPLYYIVPSGEQAIAILNAY